MDNRAPRKNAKKTSSLETDGSASRRSSGQGFEVLFRDNSKPILIERARDLRIIAANRAALLKYGYSEAEFRAMRSVDLQVAQLKPVSAERRHPEPGDGRLFIQKSKDGQIFVVEVEKLPSMYEGEDAFYNIVSDVGTWERFESSANRESGESSLILNGITDAFLMFDADLRYTYVNSSAERLIGRPAKSLIGRKLPDLFPGFVGSRSAEAFSEVLKSGKSLRYEEHIPDRKIWLAVRVYPTDQGISVYAHDISERKLNERRLNESNRRFEMLAKTLPTGVLINKIDGTGANVSFANEEALRILAATSSEQVVGRSIFDFLHPDFHDVIKQRIEKIKRGESVQPIEEKILRLDGELVDVEATATTLVSDGEMSILVVIQDISERKLTADALRESEEMLRLLIEHAPFAIAMFDRDLRYMFAGPKWIEGFDLRKDLLGRCIYDVFPEMPEKWRDIHRRCLGGATESCEEERLDRADGSTQWLRWEVRPWYDASGDVGGIVIFCEDITRRKRNQEIISELSVLIEQTYDAIFIWQYDNGIVYWNVNAVRLLGFSPEEAVGKAPFDLLKTHFPVPRTEFLRTLKETGFWEGELIHLSKDGREVTSQARLHLIQRAGDGPAVLETLQDVTERRKLEARMGRAAKLSMIGEFAAGLAHEIKNPLAGIKGVFDVLLQRRAHAPDADEEEREILEDVRLGIERIDNTVRELLQHTRPRPLEIAKMPLEETVRRAVKLSRHHRNLRRGLRGTKIRLRLPRTPLLVDHDTDKIQDVVMNLVMNAQEAIGDLPDGKILVRVASRQIRRGGPRAAIVEVSDNGSGIDPEILSEIFLPFHTTKEFGTGLGLTAVKRIVRAHGGDCHVTSELGIGSKFTIHLPLDIDK